MALQGINLPLAFNGQDGIWRKGFPGVFFLFLYVCCAQDNSNYAFSRYFKPLRQWTMQPTILIKNFKKQILV